ncbi:MAG: NYN domain-containing protein [Anaerolineales bacterium]|nr:NYN domain-containing protein [Anaerolineales bacterium]
MERVIAYIDGYNLYYGLRERKLKRFYWLNLQKLAQQYLKPGQSLVSTKYFTTVVKQPDDKRRRQARFLDALGTLPNFHIFYGQFLSDTVVCRQCGHTYTTFHEKMTDVNISVD